MKISHVNDSFRMLSSNAYEKEIKRDMTVLNKNDVSKPYSFTSSAFDVDETDKKYIAKAISSRKEPIFAFFTDIDGTLRNYSGKIPDKSKSSLKKMASEGINVVYATGRSFEELQNVLKETEFESDYYITQQGACVVDKKGNQIFADTLSKQNTLKILEAFNEYKSKDPNIHLVFYIDSMPTSLSKEADLPTNMNGKSPLKTKVVESFDEFFENGKMPTKALFYKKDSKNMSEMQPICDFMKSKMQEKDFAIFASGTWYAEITNKSVSKGTALKQICDKIGINIKNACAIGDAQNDLEMMKVVNDNGGLSIAMGNAEEIVKQTANSFTKHIDRDGYSEAVDEILKMNGKTQNSLSKFFKKVKNDARLFWHKIFYETQIDKVLKKLLSNITNVFKKIFKFIKGRF